MNTIYSQTSLKISTEVDKFTGDTTTTSDYIKLKRFKPGWMMTPITLKLYKINNHLSFEYRVGTDKVVAVDEGEKVIFLLCNDESVKLYNPNYTL